MARLFLRFLFLSLLATSEGYSSAGLDAGDDYDDDAGSPPDEEATPSPTPHHNDVSHQKLNYPPRRAFQTPMAASTPSAMVRSVSLLLAPAVFSSIFVTFQLSGVEFNMYR